MSISSIIDEIASNELSAAPLVREKLDRVREAVDGGKPRSAREAAAELVQAVGDRHDVALPFERVLVDRLALRCVALLDAITAAGRRPQVVKLATCGPEVGPPERCNLNRAAGHSPDDANGPT